MPNRSPSDHVAEIHASGLKVTTPRVKVLRIFQQGALRHWSAEEVYQALLAEGADIGLATVYRVLLQFVQAGLLSRTHFETGKSVFELNEGHQHDHLICIRCGRVEEFFDPLIDDRFTAIAAEKGYQLRDHALTFGGRCQQRRNTQKVLADRELRASGFAPRATRPLVVGALHVRHLIPGLVLRLQRR